VNAQPVNSGERLGRWLTFGVAVIGMAVVLIAFLVAVFVFRHADKPGEVIVAVLGPIGTAVGTLAGFVAGAKVGSEGRDKAEDRADQAQQKYNAVVETNSPSIVDQARSRYPDLFK
jgi:threonine dehydrogenase-like Zn-dependent dehydrogenase